MAASNSPTFPLLKQIQLIRACTCIHSWNKTVLIEMLLPHLTAEQVNLTCPEVGLCLRLSYFYYYVVFLLHAPLFLASQRTPLRYLRTS